MKEQASLITEFTADCCWTCQYSVKYYMCHALVETSEVTLFIKVATATTTVVTTDKFVALSSMELVIFSKVWEDCQLLTKGLQIQHQDHVLSITG